MSRPLWWLSFCDGSLPKGSQFLGACIVPAANMADACREAWRRGCNPGGEVCGVQFSADVPVHDGWIGRLMNKEEASGWTPGSAPTVRL